VNSEKQLLRIVEETVREHNMICSGDRILVAVSGGADSVCMLHVLNEMKDDVGFSLSCAHLNHSLRGEAADADELFVKNLCERLEIPFFSKKVDVGAVAKIKKLTVEEAGRLERYIFFDEIAREHGIDKIATAHNKNDNAETVLMRIIRGTGVEGLKGIAYVREDGVIRPILDVSRTEIEKYCSENDLSFCTDATNADNDYTRNKIRNELIPYLEKEFNSRICDGLCRLASNAREDADFLNHYAQRLYQRLGNPLPAKKPVTLHIESLSMVEKSVASRLIRLAAEDVNRGIKLEKKHIDDVFELMTKETGTEICLPKNLKVSVQYGWLSFSDDEQVGKVICDEDSFFEQVVPGQIVFVESINKDIRFHIENAQEYKCKINEIALSYDLISGQMLFIRSRRDGDRIVWFPDGKTKKIKNILIDSKIPREDRNRIPLLCTGTEVLAIVGSRVSEKYKVTDETREALVIEYGLQK